MPFGPPPCAARRDGRPVLILAAEQDQFTSPEDLREATANWPDTTVRIIEGTDHFLAGAASRVAEAVLRRLRDQF